MGSSQSGSSSAASPSPRLLRDLLLRPEAAPLLLATLAMVSTRRRAEELAKARASEALLANLDALAIFYGINGLDGRGYGALLNPALDSRDEGSAGG